jgi:hypothetical protein
MLVLSKGRLRMWSGLNIWRKSSCRWILITAVYPGCPGKIREKLAKFKPLNLGQASRISGVTPVAISLLMVYLRKVNG